MLLWGRRREVLMYGEGQYFNGYTSTEINRGEELSSVPSALEKISSCGVSPFLTRPGKKNHRPILPVAQHTAYRIPHAILVRRPGEGRSPS